MQAEPAQPAFAAIRQFITRLHFYVGLFVGPFLLVAAITGTLYVLTPQIENLLYRDQLVARTTGPERPLAEQIAAARASIGEAPRLFAVRPATAPGLTTRVMFTQPDLGESETRTVFVDPASLAVQGELITYGTSGILPFRITLDYLHRNLLLGDIGRHYSELAASWLWFSILGGLLLWYWQRSVARPKNAKVSSWQRSRRLHTLIGLWTALGLLFLSATGLTWSRWAGGNIDTFRNEVGWITPAITTALNPHAAAPVLGEHAAHGMGGAVDTAPPVSEQDMVARFDGVVASARAAGIDSPMIEIRPPRTVGQAFRVSEYDRSWPTQVDTIAVDPSDFKVTSRADFETFPIVAKLIRWGIDAHMGVLFGVANQALMAALGIALTAMIVYGYRMWWLRRPAPGTSARTLIRSFSYLPPVAKITALAVALFFGIALPVMGASLLVFLLIDFFRAALAEMMAAEQRNMPPGMR
ncbi:membrane protein [Rhizobium wenxiniae]|uniref:Putative iron-regulated membrane protein n=1 Tax=Rhizobium wenxiniae TaxID=1737357 RepID=A0A7X0CYI0_9HYPH|nr:PepSY-associated TM helix domain-containing protein [Rhizobium wenxiniae]MBB6161304.1 putative iron-regulated membrane protein [Rhizobium wenxiniae]GGF87828.1 membrane protein [Rhizobium wenxiniae]